MAAAPPRRLPARVYWVRRGLVVLVASALATAVVLGVVGLVGTAGEQPVTDRAAAVRSAPQPEAAPVLGPHGAAPVRRRAAGAQAVPTGECAPEGISTAPTVLAGPGVGAVPAEPGDAASGGPEDAAGDAVPGDAAPGDDPTGSTESPVAPPAEEDAAPRVTGIAEAGDPVTVQIALQGTEPACTFTVSPRTVAVKISTAEGGSFWASQDCPGPLPREEVVVRSGEQTLVEFRWNARDSRSGCGDQALWALPGDYRLQATVQGSTPGESTFELVRPSAVYVTETPSPEADPDE